MMTYRVIYNDWKKSEAKINELAVEGFHVEFCNVDVDGWVHVLMAKPDRLQGRVVTDDD